MPRETRTLDDMNNALFVDFLYTLRDYGVPASPKELLDLNTGFEKGLVKTLDDLFIFSRLTFVRRVEHMDGFERAFAFYFYGVDIPAVAPDDMDLFQTKQFREWLSKMIEDGELPERALYTMDPMELMDKFWETVREQMEEHHGGSKWVGTQGNSPFGHSGNAAGGVRVGGQSGNRSALKVISNRRYIAYSDKNKLRSDNLRQALESMKHMKNVGARDELNLDKTIYETSRNGGEIELVFEREKRDRMTLCLLIDNGGYSMDPFIDVTRLMFSKMHERFEEIKTYYFHNTIYQHVYKDFRRTEPLKTEEFLQRKEDTRVVIIGDATMAPEELESPHGSLYYYAQDPRASTYWLKRISERFKHSCWLNPIPKSTWSTVYGAWTLNRIRDFFHMEDMTLGGIKGMVEHLSES